MGERKKYEPGTFNWVDLGTTNAADAKRFYSGLFGWGIHDMPMGPDSFYTMFEMDGKHMCALYQQTDEQRAQGIPPSWMSYVSVKDADETAKQVARLGGTVMMAPFDVFDSGRMALLRDPTGAVFSIWEPKNHIGAALVNQPNAFSWNELLTSDRVAAGTFYTRLFGWTAKHEDMPVGPYTIFFNGDRAGAGMMQLTDEMRGVPPHWMVYFSVADCDASVERVRELGGQLLNGPIDIPVGRFAVVRDPQGAAFSITQLVAPDD